MQRRNVDLPEPDGPTMHITSPLPTSSVMPLSTCKAPKLLQTASAFTIGVMRPHLLLPALRLLLLALLPAPRPAPPVASWSTFGSHHASSTAPGSTGRPSGCW